MGDKWFFASYPMKEKKKNLYPVWVFGGLRENIREAEYKYKVGNNTFLSGFVQNPSKKKKKTRPSYSNSNEKVAEIKIRHLDFSWEKASRK